MSAERAGEATNRLEAWRGNGPPRSFERERSPWRLAQFEQLEAIHQAKSNARKRQLRKELAQLKMGAAEPLAKYVSRAKEIQNQLRATGYTLSDQEVAWALLAGLPQAYDTVVTVLETSTDADVRLEDILPKLMPVEQKMRSESSPPPSEAALLAKRNSSFGAHQNLHETRTCYACGEKGHIARNCPNRGARASRNFSAIAL